LTFGRGLPPPGNPSPTWDIHRPTRMHQHRSHKLTSEGTNKAKPVLNSWLTTCPTGSGHSLHGNPPTPAPFLRSPTGPRRGGQAPSGPHEPQPGRRRRVPRTRRQADPHQQKFSSSAGVLPIGTTQTRGQIQTHSHCSRPNEHITRPTHAHGPLARTTSSLAPGAALEAGSDTPSPKKLTQSRLAKGPLPQGPP